MKSWILALLPVLAGLASIARAAEEGSPVKVESGISQLFVDDYLIETQDGLKRTLHQPKKDGGGNMPLLALDKEFDPGKDTLEANGTIVYDPKLGKWVMITVGISANLKGQPRTRLYRFTSPDAMNWIKGDDGQPEHIQTDLYDPVSKTSATNTDLFSYYYDTTDSETPYKGWLWFANWGDDREGIYYVSSRDGKTWQRGGQIIGYNNRTFQAGGRTLIGPNDVTIFYADPLSKRFLALIKFTSKEPVGPKNLLRSRAYMFVDSLNDPVDIQRLDHVDLVPAAAASGGDMPHDEYYGSTAWRAGSHWVGGLKIWHGGGDYPYSAAGSAFLKLAVSRDGLHWKKVPFANEDGHPEVFIPNGKEGGNNGRNDGGYMTEFSQGPLRIGDELIFYYGSSSWGKNHEPGKRISGGGIFRARLRPDGYVSVDAGSLTTKPLAFEKKNLFVNGIGPIDVELLDASSKVVAKATVQGDSLKHKVMFDGRALRDVAGGNTVRLRFAVRQGGQLYSFKIGANPVQPTVPQDGKL
jgi:hypothetical protein